MGDANPICTLGDYSKPCHEGYSNTIELPVGNNVVPLRSDTVRLVQNGCSFHGLWSEDPNQHLKDFLKLVDLLDLDSENRYTQIDINHAAGGNLKGLSAEEAWETIEDCAQCDKQWKNPTSTIFDQTITNLKDHLVGNEVVRVKIPKCMSWLDAYDEPIGDLDMMEDKVIFDEKKLGSS
ncbi:hypothetical protein Tco_0237124 [Tanacetum coccineum]